MTTSSGATTAYTYDAHGNVLTMVSPDGNVPNCGCAAKYTTTYTYDAENHLLTTTDPDGYTTTNTYDANGNLLTVTDGDGNVTTNAYNPLNQLAWTYTGAAAEPSNYQSPPPGATITTYDADGHVLTVTDGNGDVTTNGYSGTGQLCWTYLGSSGNGCSSPPAEATVYTYDANGNLLTTTKPSGQTITNAYNAANQLCWTYQGVVSNPSCGSPPTSGTYAVFTYDPDGRVLTMTDPTGTSTWSYNAQGQELTSTNGAGAEVQYGYDLNGNQTSSTSLGVAPPRPTPTTATGCAWARRRGAAPPPSVGATPARCPCSSRRPPRRGPRATSTVPWARRSRRSSPPALPITTRATTSGPPGR